MNHILPPDGHSGRPNAARSFDVAEFLRLIHPSGSVFEIRSLKCPDRPGSSYTGTASGVFNDIDAAVKGVAELEKCKPVAIYLTANPVNPALLARANNRIAHRARATTSDADIVRRKALLIDIDPIRPADISSTDSEMQAAIDLSKIIEHDLGTLGWPPPIRGMTGNGACLIYRVDLENSDESLGLVQDSLAALASIYDSDEVRIDKSVFNAARIMKVLGTQVRKGDEVVGTEGVEDRPHRQSWFIPPTEWTIVRLDQLETLAARKPAAKPAATKATDGSYKDDGAFQIDKWFRDKFVPVGDPKPYRGGRKWHFDELPILCRNAPSGHGHDNSAFIIEFPSGALSAGCRHDRCTWGWRELREAYEPGCYDDQETDDVDISGILGSFSKETSTNQGNPEVVCSVQDSGDWKRSVPDSQGYTPFPSAALPRVLKKFVEAAANSICCDASFVALPLLTGFATAIGNSMGLIVKHGWIVPPILWTVVVAESGSAKSPPFRAALAPLYRRQRKMVAEFDIQWKRYELELERYNRDASNYRKSKSSDGQPPEPPAKPKCPRCLVSDATIEALGSRLEENPRGILSDNHELSGWFGAFNRYSGKGGADESAWLKFFNGEYVVIDRKYSPRPLIIERAAVFLTGTIQPGILKKHLTAEHRESGLASRLLFAMPPRIKRSWNDLTIEESIRNRIELIVDRLFTLEMRELDGCLLPNLCSLEGTAKQLFVAYYNRHSDEQNRLHGDLYAAFSKLEEYAARFALILHCIRWAIGEVSDSELFKVDSESMEAGIQICEWFKQEARRVYSVLSENEIETVNRKFLDWLERMTEPMTPAEIFQSHRRSFRNSGAIEFLLSKFVKDGLGEWINVSPTDRGGRPTRKYRHKAYTEQTTTENTENA